MSVKKFVATVIFLVLFSQTNVFSQYYGSAIGLRLGNASGITGKIFLGGKTYLEGMLTTRWDGINITALAEFSQNMVDTPGLGWYYGFGANIGFWKDRNEQDNDTDLFVGVDAIVGMEYTFDSIPMNLSIDWKPYINIITHPGFIADEFALSVRYAF